MFNDFDTNGVSSISLAWLKDKPRKKSSKQSLNEHTTDWGLYQTQKAARLHYMV